MIEINLILMLFAGTLSWMKILLNPTPIPRCGHQTLSLPYYHENQEQDEVLIFGGGDNDGAFFHDLISASIPLNPEADTAIPSYGSLVLENVENQVKGKWIGHFVCSTLIVTYHHQLQVIYYFQKEQIEVRYSLYSGSVNYLLVFLGDISLFKIG